MESSLKDEIEASGSLLNHAKAEPLSVMAKAASHGVLVSMQLHLILVGVKVVYGVFRSVKASIYDILNFVGREKCSTSAVNGDSIFCTRASMENGARPFTASFMWLSSC